MNLFGLEISRAKRPSATVERQSKRPPALKLNRFLDAANLGRLEESWKSTPQTADTIIRNDWRTTVARTRENLGL